MFCNLQAWCSRFITQFLRYRVFLDRRAIYCLTCFAWNKDAMYVFCSGGGTTGPKGPGPGHNLENSRFWAFGPGQDSKKLLRWKIWARPETKVPPPLVLAKNSFYCIYYLINLVEKAGGERGNGINSTDTGPNTKYEQCFEDSYIIQTFRWTVECGVVLPPADS